RTQESRKQRSGSERLTTAIARDKSFLGSDFSLKSCTIYRREHIFSRELTAGWTLDCGMARLVVHLDRRDAEIIAKCLLNRRRTPLAGHAVDLQHGLTNRLVQSLARLFVARIARYCCCSR